MSLIRNQITTFWRYVTKSFTHSILVFTFVFGPHFSQACTVFASKTDGKIKFVAKNFDWQDGKGSLIYTPADQLEHQSIELFGFKWKANLRSLSFHLDANNDIYNDEHTSENDNRFPMSGMNEKGLTVEVLLLKGTVYPVTYETQGNRLNQLELVRYLLDTASTITDVRTALNLINENKLNLENRFKHGLHYITCDLEDCLVFEFIDGKLKINGGNASLRYLALSNIEYEKGLKALPRYEGFSGTLVRKGPNPSGRFAIASWASINSEHSILNDVFQVLVDAAIKVDASPTQWSYVYEPSLGVLSIKDTGGARLLPEMKLDLNTRQETKPVKVSSLLAR